jgi:hypothetical protein
MSVVMTETREICGVEIELTRDETGTVVRIGDACLDAAEVAALQVARADWSGVVRIDQFEFGADAVRELQDWVAGA